jgi:hypothetical protein
MANTVMKPTPDFDLDEIYEKFIKPHYYVSCNEFHAHTRKCVRYTTKEANVIDWLRLEVIDLRKQLEKIHKIIEE